MTAAKEHDPGQRRRTSELAAIHVGKKFLELDDVTYRALLKRLTGKDSSSQMTPAERGRVLEYMREQGFSSGALGRNAARFAGRAADRKARPFVGLIRALWLSLYHLGEVDDPSEAALAHFVERQTGVSALQWLDGSHADAAIKALRGWLARVGLPQPRALYVRQIDAWRAQAQLQPGGPGFAAKVALVDELWRRLDAAGALKHGSHARLETWLRVRFRGTAAPHFLSPAQADDAIEQLGAWLRRFKAGL